LKQKKIIFIICYLGKLPWYFDYFVHSCKYNLSVGFIIIADDLSYTNKVPPNVKFVHNSLIKINSLANEKLGFTTKIGNAYKLCDFKPAYGLLFSELIQDYDYWGHADIDMIFGNIREFITDDLLNTYDLISVRHDFLTGQFLLFRNNSKMNNLFRMSKDYQKVLSSEQHYCFDETNFQWDGFTAGKHYSEIPSEIESMTHLVKRLEEEKYIKPFFDFLIIEGLPGKLKWDNGSLFYKNKFEILLYHMVLFKKVCKPVKLVGKIPNTFTISPTRIYHH
jgi:hypothetical protein